MPVENLQIPVAHAGVEWVSGRIDAPDSEPGDDASALVLAHGAGRPMDGEFMDAIAEGLAARGIAVLRFNYAYAERGTREGKRRPPDRRQALLDVHRAALAVAHERFGARRLLLGGKSMGGRMSSYLAAEGEDCAGLVFFGYPLHPPGKPDKLRTEHFAAIAQPALFLSGTRDALCKLELLEPALELFGGRPTLAVIEGGNHDFAVLKKSGQTRAEVLGELCERVVEWESASFPR